MHASTDTGLVYMFRNWKSVLVGMPFKIDRAVRAPVGRKRKLYK